MINSELNILKSLLNQNGYVVSDDLLEIQFLSHPDKSNLNSITDTLDYFTIEHIAAEISVENLEEIENPFIAHLAIQNESQFVLVRSQTKEHVITFDGKAERSIKKDEFFKLWTGVIIAVNKNEHKKLSPTRNPATLILLLAGSSIPFLLGVPFINIVFYLLNIIGVLLSILIVQKSLGYQNKLTNKFCGADEKSACNKLINNTDLKLPFSTNLGDISLVYFVSLVFNSLADQLQLINILSILSIPIIIFSIIFQAVIVKQWCKLCLGIVSVLILQLAINIFLSTNLISFNSQIIYTLISYALLFIIFLSIWLVLKNELAKTAEIKELKIENLKFRRDYHLYLAYYSRQQIIDTVLPNQTPEISLGNPNAIVQLIAVTNPMCQPCSKAHEVYHRLLELYPDKIFLRIRFYVPVGDENDPRMDIATKLLMINEILSNPNEMGPVLYKWYKEKQLPASVTDLLTIKPKDKFNTALKIQRKWCTYNRINITPTLLINGKIFPDNYQISDIENLIPAIIEKEELNTKNPAYLSSYDI